MRAQIAERDTQLVVEPAPLGGQIDLGDLRQQGGRLGLRIGRLLERLVVAGDPEAQQRGPDRFKTVADLRGARVDVRQGRHPADLIADLGQLEGGEARQAEAERHQHAEAAVDLGADAELERSHCEFCRI